jgi:hypothetical protein
MIRVAAATLLFLPTCCRRNTAEDMVFKRAGRANMPKIRSVRASRASGDLRIIGGRTGEDLSPAKEARWLILHQYNPCSIG